MSKNTTVTHLSPMLTYIPETLWMEGTFEDPFLSNYINASYHATNSSQGNGSVTLHWFGEGGVWIYGGYRSRLGPYQVTLDGVTQSQPGYEEGDDEDFDYVLFSNQSLLQGDHQLELSNLGSDTGSILDLNRIVFETPLTGITTIDDTDPGCLWRPHNTTSNNLVWNVDNTSHTTSDALGSMTLNFTVCLVSSWNPLNSSYFSFCGQGVGIEVYGSISPTSSPFSVTLDGLTSKPFTSNSHIPNNMTSGKPPSQLIYYKYNIPEGQHTLLLRNNPAWSSDTTTLDIDYIVAYGKVLSSASTNQPKQQQPGYISKVIASAVGSVIGLIILLILWRTFHRLRSTKNAKKEKFRARPFSLRPRGLIPLVGSSPPSSPTPGIRVSFDVTRHRKRSSSITMMQQLQRANTMATLVNPGADTIIVVGNDGQEDASDHLLAKTSPEALASSYRHPLRPQVHRPKLRSPPEIAVNPSMTFPSIPTPIRSTSSPTSNRRRRNLPTPPAISPIKLPHLPLASLSTPTSTPALSPPPRSSSLSSHSASPSSKGQRPSPPAGTSFSSSARSSVGTSSSYPTESGESTDIGSFPMPPPLPSTFILHPSTNVYEPVVANGMSEDHRGHLLAVVPELEENQDVNISISDFSTLHLGTLWTAVSFDHYLIY
ncbi:hypothetical protein ABKN59_008280 [Abortiporus biennis]